MKFALYWKILSVPVMKLVLDYRVILALSVVSLVLLSWKLRKFVNLYAGFPTYPLIRHILMASVLRKIPSDIPYHGIMFKTVVEATKRFQNEGMFLAWLLQPHLFIYDEEAVKILSNEEAALDRPCKYDVLKDIFKTGLLTSHTETWRKQRKLLNPTFNLRILKSKLSIFNDNAEILVQNLSEFQNNSSVDVIKYIKPCSLVNVCEFTLGFKMNSACNKELIEVFENNIVNLQQMMAYRMVNPWFHYNFMMNLFPSGRTYLKHLNDLHSFTQKIILTMKENIISSKLTEIDTEDEVEDEKNIRKSFVQILLEYHLKDPSYTIDDIESEVTTFIAAGFESVAYTVTWCLFMLGHHQDVQDQSYNEVKSISGDHIKYEDLLQLKYLDSVVKETLRLYPTIPLYGRRLDRDIQCGKYKVPKDTSILFFLYGLHRNPKIYPDPENFNPDRFMEGNIEPWNFTPFSEGIRYCIGKRFAMMEIKVVLAHILRHFRITSLDRKEDVVLCWEILLTPARPLRFQLMPRK